MKYVSSYIIGSPVGENKALLVHGYSGAVDLVDSSINDYLGANKGKPVDIDILEDDVFQFLLKRGYITKLTKEEEHAYVFRMAKALQEKNRLTGASFTIVVTYDCNLCCPYCFEKENAWKLKGQTLDRASVDKIFSTIDNIRSSVRNPSREITLFGGEPLLRKNLEIVEYIVSEGKKRGLRFSAITNGVELDSFLHLIDKALIGHLQITMDGVGDTHDKTRCHSNGLPTFDTIVSNIRSVLEKGISISVRFNADRENASEFALLENYFTENGFYSYPKFHASMSRTINYDSSVDTSKFFTQKDFLTFIGQKPGGHVQDFSVFRILSKAVHDKKPLAYKGAFCSSQINGYVFDPMHNVYPCWEVIGDSDHIIGDYTEGFYRPRLEASEQWHSSGVVRKQCLQCPSLLLCGGGCFAKNLHNFKCTQITEIIRRNAPKIYSDIIAHNESQIQK